MFLKGLADDMNYNYRVDSLDVVNLAATLLQTNYSIE